jgi:hypothetical protein
MKTTKKGWPSSTEADDYRRRARDAERAAEASESPEARQFYLELAKQCYEMADSAERNERKAD